MSLKPTVQKRKVVKLYSRVRQDRTSQNGPLGD